MGDRWPPSTSAQRQALAAIISKRAVGRNYTRLPGLARAVAALYRSMPRPLGSGKWKQLATLCQQHGLAIRDLQLKNQKVGGGGLRGGGGAAAAKGGGMAASGKREDLAWFSLLVVGCVGGWLCWIGRDRDAGR